MKGEREFFMSNNLQLIRNLTIFRFALMKQLLYIAFIIYSATGFAQEKGPICNIGIRLRHENGTQLGDYLHISELNLSHSEPYGAFHQVSTTSDSLIYEITLPSGDSLSYHGSWANDGWGPCLVLPNPEQLDSVVEVLDGEPFPIVTTGTYTAAMDYSLSQDAMIRTSCFFEIKAAYEQNPQSYFVRVNFLESSVGVAEEPVTNDISMWLTDQNTLSVKTNENAILDLYLYSLSGQLVQRATIEGSQSIDISALPKGYYVLHASDQNGLERRLKFVK